MLKLMKRVWKSDGLQGFLRGCDPPLSTPPFARSCTNSYSVSLASFVPYTVIYWETYEHLKASYTGKNSATPDLTFSLPASGFAAGTPTHRFVAPHIVISCGCFCNEPARSCTHSVAGEWCVLCHGDTREGCPHKRTLQS